MSDIQSRSEVDLWVDPELTPYKSQVQAVQKYAIENGLPVWKAAEPYLGEYVQQPGKYNQRVKAIKKILEIQLDVVTDPIERAARQRVRSGLRQIKTEPRSVEERSPSGQEVEKLIERAPLHLGLIIQFLWESGCRISEALNAELANVRELDAETMEVRIVGKGKKAHKYYFSAKLYRLIGRAFGGERWFFEHRTRDGKPGKYESTGTSNRIGWLSQVVLGQPYRAHSIRHAKAIYLRDQGVPREKVQAMLGHKSAQTTDIYYKPQWTAGDFQRTR